jgi:polyhydroxyalkanoate synthase subunit PhaC
VTSPAPTSWAGKAHLNAEELNAIRAKFIEQWNALAQSAAQGQLPPVEDRRFKDPAWTSSPMHLLMAHLYMLSGDAMKRMVESTTMDPDVKDQLRFSVMQWVDAMSPANYLATNPEAQKALIDSGGKTLQVGMANLMSDLQKGRITHTDEDQFEVGKNLAITPGSVVFQNAFFQLIQYVPQTKTVYQKPLLMVPPCINKFYIFDLQPENSLVRHLVSEGHTVFVVSWRNPLPEDQDGMEKATWDDYIEQGIIQAIDVVQEISKQPKINALGFCVGGTMLTTGLAVLAARRKTPVASLTLLATMLDFVDTGPLGVFANAAHAKMREQSIGAGGLMTARELANTFSFLRPNELVWNYVVSNYLKGQTPLPFDLLYWNGDSTNLPGPFFTWYFRHTYLENKLCVPGALEVCGKPVDIGKLNIPAYLMASKDDHIVPWHTAYHSGRLLSGQSRFVLGASGHIAGVINPPSKNKRNYWTSEADLSVEPDAWFALAEQHPGSWWPDYVDWLSKHGGRRVAAPKSAGSKTYRVIEPAPGQYVKVRAV